MPKVLIIDDAPFITDIYRRFLEREGFSVEVDLDGREAYSRITESKPDAVLLDVMLKNITGLEILQKVREKTEFRDLPIIILSSTTSLSLFRKLKEAGATRLFNKVSSKPAEVVEAIKLACAERLVTSPEPAIDGQATTEANKASENPPATPVAQEISAEKSEPPTKGE